nr:hypothetical protein [Rhodococcus sp. (in: high G+C Gram-positive bacteria)]
MTDRRVIVRRPNTLLGIFPKGYYEQTSPLGHISEVNAGESFSTRHVLYAAGAILFGLLNLASGAFGPIGILLGLLLIGVGVLFLLNAHSIGIGFRNHGAGVLFAAAGKAERRRVEEAKAAINSLLFADGAELVPPVAATPPTAQNPVPAPPRTAFTSAQASDPSTPQSVLLQIAEREPSLRPLVATNPNTYPGLLDWLQSLGDPAVDRALSTRIGVARF